MGGYVTHFSVQCIIPVTDVWHLIIPKMGGWRKAKFTLFFLTQKMSKTMLLDTTILEILTIL
jgi:hypothetical protein